MESCRLFVFVYLDYSPAFADNTKCFSTPHVYRVSLQTTNEPAELSTLSSHAKERYSLLVVPLYASLHKAQMQCSASLAIVFGQVNTGRSFPTNKLAFCVPTRYKNSRKILNLDASGDTHRKPFAMKWDYGWRFWVRETPSAQDRRAYIYPCIFSPLSSSFIGLGPSTSNYSSLSFCERIREHVGKHGIHPAWTKERYIWAKACPGR